MPKRKRSGEDELSSKLTEYQQELFRALKAAKGFERQRLSKRVHAEQAPDKVQRLEREITVLKSLDLQQTAQAHLSSSLAKFKSIAEHPSLPDQIKHGAPKPDLTEEARTALHNVTSGLYNHQNVRDVIDKALRGVCLTLEIPIPEKKGRKRGDRDAKQNATESSGTKTTAHGLPATETEVAVKKRRIEHDDDDAGSSDSFKGFSGDDTDDGGTDGDEEDNSDPDAYDEETAVERFASRLGGSDDSGSDEENASALRAKYAALLGMRGEAPSEEDSDSNHSHDLGFDLADLAADDDNSEEDSDDASDVVAQDEDKSRQKPSQRKPLPSPSPPPPARKKKEAKAVKSGSTTFLPTLMGGYFSGSESASDVDVAPRKKRLGQRQRQAIAERKHGEKANHVRDQASKQKNGRDSGWDMRRGAVDGENPGKGRQPWKRGIANPLGGDGKTGAASGKRGGQQENHSRKPKSRDDQGALHPSWEARKKAKETQQAAFQGTKITF